MQPSRQVTQTAAYLGTLDIKGNLVKVTFLLLLLFLWPDDPLKLFSAQRMRNMHVFNW